MNSKKAKKLRHRAFSLTVGQPNVKYEGVAPDFLNENGERILVPECTKAVYKKLKKQYMNRKSVRRG